MSGSGPAIQRALPDHHQGAATSGAVTIDRPKLRGTGEAFTPAAVGVGVCRTNALESLVIAGFVQGLSVRRHGGHLADALGAEAALSSPRSVGSAGAIRSTSTPGRSEVCRTSRWSTCSWTDPTSACMKALGPSRCWPPGASRPRPASAGRPRSLRRVEVDRRLEGFLDGIVGRLRGEDIQLRSMTQHGAEPNSMYSTNRLTTGVLRVYCIQP